MIDGNNFLFPDPDFDDAQSPWEENLKEKFLPQP